VPDLPAGATGSMAGDEAFDLVTRAARGAMKRVGLHHIRIVPDQAGPSCLLPSQDGFRVSSVDGEALLATAELLASTGRRMLRTDHSDVTEDAPLAIALWQSAMRPGQAEMWPLALQVRWLGVAVKGSECVDGVQGIAAAPEVLAGLLAAIAAQPVHALLPHASPLFAALSGIAASQGLGGHSGGVAANTTTLACLLVKEIRQNLFRLTLKESCCVLDGCFQLRPKLPADKAAALQAEAQLLLAKAIESLPAKFRAETVFHRKHHQGIASSDVVAWCHLLANDTLLQFANGARAVPDDTWKHLAQEACQVIERGDLDDAAATLLGAFVAEGRRRRWSAADTQSPLGSVVAALRSEWQRVIACDGELEDPIHEPLPMPEAVEHRLRELFAELEIAPPQR